MCLFPRISRHQKRYLTCNIYIYIYIYIFHDDHKKLTEVVPVELWDRLLENHETVRSFFRFVWPMINQAISWPLKLTHGRTNYRSGIMHRIRASVCEYLYNLFLPGGDRNVGTIIDDLLLERFVNTENASFPLTPQFLGIHREWSRRTTTGIRKLGPGPGT